MMFECIDKIYPSVSIDTVTGSICTFTDNIGGLPLKSCTSLISGYQEGSGTPSPSNVRPLHAFSSATLTDNGNTYTFTFGQDIYQGYIDWKRGVVIALCGYFTDNGSRNWIKEGDNNYYTQDVIDNVKSTSLVECNMQISVAGGFTGGANAWMSFSGRFNITIPEITQLTDFINLIQTTPIQVAYELATPIEIPLGGINLLTQEGQNNIFADCGDTTVEYINIT